MAKKKVDSPPPVPITEIARRVQQGAMLFNLVANEIELVEGDLDARVVADFKALDLKNRANVDYAIAALNEARAGVNKAHALAKFYGELAERCNRILEKAEETIKQTVSELPGIPFTGETGEFKLIGNGGDKPLVIDPTVQTTHKHFQNLVDPGMAFEYGIPPKYLETIQLVRLNTALLRQDLEDGVVLDKLASIGERGTRLGYPAIKLNKPKKRGKK